MCRRCSADTNIAYYNQRLGLCQCGKLTNIKVKKGKYWGNIEKREGFYGRKLLTPDGEYNAIFK